MKKDHSEKLLRHLIALCDDISKGRFKKVKELFELTKESKYPPLITELAESFGMMMVKVDAREYHLAEVIDDLKKAQVQLSVSKERLARENVDLKQNLRKRFATSGILGKSIQMVELLKQVEKVASTSANILITGETGTGKELVARAIHYNSPRAEKPFVAINCSAIPETVFESEMFGIEKGVATGVDKRLGKIEEAHEGTLFLDEIGEMPLSLQVKILRVMEDHRLERVGGRKAFPVNIRLVAATNKDLREEIGKKMFREDLFYRLNVVNLHIASLRDRKGDVELLAHFFLEESARRLSKPPLRFSPEALTFMRQYAWPGNVRELMHEVERAAILAYSDTITAEDLSENIRNGSAGLIPYEKGSLSVKDNEKEHIQKIFEKTGGNKSETARLLGLSREGLRKKMKRYQLC